MICPCCGSSAIALLTSVECSGIKCKNFKKEYKDFRDFQAKGTAIRPQGTVNGRFSCKTNNLSNLPKTALMQHQKDYLDLLLSKKRRFPILKTVGTETGRWSGSVPVISNLPKSSLGLPKSPTQRHKDLLDQVVELAKEYNRKHSHILIPMEPTWPLGLHFHGF